MSDKLESLMDRWEGLLTEFSRHCVDCEQNMDSKEQAKAKTALRTHVEGLEAEVERYKAAVDVLTDGLEFFAGMIKEGEVWVPACQVVMDAVEEAKP